MQVARHPAAAGLPGMRPIWNPSRRARSDPYPGLINRPNRGTPIGPNHTVPYGTVPVFARIPGNKLPGYDHSVPAGQSPTTPCGTKTSADPFSRPRLSQYGANICNHVLHIDQLLVPVQKLKLTGRIYQ